MHESKEQLQVWKEKINAFLRIKLKLELHKDKSKIIPLSRGIDFVGFRNYWHFKLVRKRNIKRMRFKVKRFSEEKISYRKIMESFQGWQAYAVWGNSFKLRKKIIKEIYRAKKLLKPKQVSLNKYL